MRIDVTELQFFTDAPAVHLGFIRCNERPYITIVTDLGVQPGGPNRSATENEPSVLHLEASAQIPVKSNAQATTAFNLNIDAVRACRAKKTDKSTHPRYAITIVVCSNAV